MKAIIAAIDKPSIEFAPKKYSNKITPEERKALEKPIYLARYE